MVLKKDKNETQESPEGKRKKKDRLSSNLVRQPSEKEGKNRGHGGKYQVQDGDEGDCETIVLRKNQEKGIAESSEGKEGAQEEEYLKILAQVFDS